MDDVGERIALGFAAAERQRRANVEGAEVREIDGLLLAFANVPDPPVNSVLVISEPADPVARVHGRRAGVPRTGSPARRRHRGRAAPLRGSRDPGGGAHAALRVAGHGGRRRRPAGGRSLPTASAWSRSPTSAARPRSHAWSRSDPVANRRSPSGFYAAASYGGDGARVVRGVGRRRARRDGGRLSARRGDRDLRRRGGSGGPSSRYRHRIVGDRRSRVPGRSRVAPHR